MAKNMQTPGACLCLHPFIDLEIPTKPLIIAASKTTLKPWNKFMKIVTKGFTASFVPMSNRLWTSFWIAEILKNGFARIKCEDCGHEYLLAFSCKRRHFCPSCHQKRVVEFGEWLCQNVIKAVPHRHFVFGIPKILRKYFFYDRRLLLELSRCIWESLKIYYQHCVPGNKSVPGAAIAIQTFGDFLGFNPHGHVLVTDGCFPEKGLFKVAPAVKLKYLEKIFRSKVLTLLLFKGKITPDHINLLNSWKHSGFQVFCGPRILPRKKEAMENLARYIIWASFSQERMTYFLEPVVSLKVERESRIIYRSKDNR
jgi:hypothetical protein